MMKKNSWLVLGFIASLGLAQVAMPNLAAACCKNKKQCKHDKNAKVCNHKECQTKKKCNCKEGAGAEAKEEKAS